MNKLALEYRKMNILAIKRDFREQVQRQFKDKPMKQIRAAEHRKWLATGMTNNITKQMHFRAQNPI